jgi:phosphoribosylaminoimidazole-succinocarboxamide synthase
LSTPVVAEYPGGRLALFAEAILANPLFESSIKSLPLLTRGKVRDMYGLDDKHLLIVTSDRLSAFDVILSDPIPDKGAVLNAMANFWFTKLQHVVPNHLTGIAPESVVKGADELAQVKGRAVVVKRLKPLPIEAVVRGYIIGSGWKDYQATGKVCGIALPAGLKQAEKLPEIIFTPATKADVGDHDENISYEETEKKIGAKLAAQVRDVSIRLYKEASDYARERGIIIADTKFEFGLDDAGTLVLIDEILTADSSRFWPADQYQPGSSPPSYDKQFVRDYLETLDWNKKAPAPKLPADVIAKTSEKYREALMRLTGTQLEN